MMLVYVEVTGLWVTGSAQPQEIMRLHNVHVVEQTTGQNATTGCEIFLNIVSAYVYHALTYTVTRRLLFRRSPATTGGFEKQNLSLGS